MVRLGGFEPPTHGLGNRCSVQLSYKRITNIIHKYGNFFKSEEKLVCAVSLICIMKKMGFMPYHFHSK